MKINKKQIFSALILGLMFLAVLATANVPVVKSAAPNSAWNNQVGMSEVGAEYGETTQSADSLITIIVRIINFSLLFLGIIFVALFIFSGYQWMTAAGNEDTIEKAKSRMTNAVIGVVIVLSAWAITGFVIYRLLYVTTGNPVWNNEAYNFTF